MIEPARIKRRGSVSSRHTQKKVFSLKQPTKTSEEREREREREKSFKKQ